MRKKRKQRKVKSIEAAIEAVRLHFWKWDALPREWQAPNPSAMPPDYGGKRGGSFEGFPELDE